MSGRCKSCDAILDEFEMKSKDPLTGQYTELCDNCIVLSEEDLDLEDIFEEANLYSEDDIL